MELKLPKVAYGTTPPIGKLPESGYVDLSTNKLYAWKNGKWEEVDRGVRSDTRPEGVPLA